LSSKNALRHVRQVGNTAEDERRFNHSPGKQSRWQTRASEISMALPFLIVTTIRNSVIGINIGKHDRRLMAADPTNFLKYCDAMKIAIKWETNLRKKHRTCFVDQALEDWQRAAVLLILRRCLDMRSVYFMLFSFSVTAADQSSSPLWPAASAGCSSSAGWAIPTSTSV
jgi:hypothetical protein